MLSHAHLRAPPRFPHSAQGSCAMGTRTLLAILICDLDALAALGDISAEARDCLRPTLAATWSSLDAWEESDQTRT